MKNYEYAIFTEEKPLQFLKDDCKSLPFFKRIKIAPYIKRAEALSRKAESWSKFIRCRGDYAYICTLFMIYFDTKIDKDGKLMYIPRDPGREFLMFFIATNNKSDDKYIKKANMLIRSYSESIDYFIKAFLSIRTAKEELKKLTQS